MTLISIVISLAVVAFVTISISGYHQNVLAEQQARRHQALHEQNEARHRRVAYQEHLRRAAFDHAHPEIVAQRKAAAAARAAALAQARAATRAHQLALERRAAAEKASAEQQQYAIDHACDTAHTHEKSAARETGQAEYDDAVSGLHYAGLCDDKDDQLVQRGYLLSMKAYAEHDLGTSDWQTDFNQANALLVECQTTPGFYGESVGANCETQEEYNIKASTNWEIAAQE